MVMVFDGKRLASQKEKELAVKVAEFRKKFDLAPKLVAVAVGNNPASKLYLGVKKRAAKRVGILFEEKKFGAGVGPKEITGFIKSTNRNSSVHGIMIQLPLPKKLVISNWKLGILGAIAPSKDVDCLTPENLGLLMMGQPRFLPATVKAVTKILERVAGNTFLSHEEFAPAVRETAGLASKFVRKDYSATLNTFSKGGRVDSPKVSKFAQKDYFTVSRALKGKEIVIIGAGDLVGKPLAIHLKNLGATVTICDEFTKNLAGYTRKAEILISATGVPKLIKKETVKKGAVVIDVGSPKGEVDFEEVRKVASFITPVPGGIGPLTVISLLENVLLAVQN